MAAAYGRIPGALLIADELPLAPTREFAAPILGTRRRGDRRDDQGAPRAYQPGDVAGLSGLQARYDEQLRGTPGAVVEAVPAGRQGTARAVPHRRDRRASRCALTLDPGLQTEAEQLLAGVGPASALVAIRPSTGEILAAANGPGNGGQNLATFGQSAPGSTFKTVSSLALLRAGLTPDTVVPCTAHDHRRRQAVQELHRLPGRARSATSR